MRSLANIVRRKNPGSLQFLDLCDKRRELRTKRFEPEGSEKYREVNSNIKRCMKKAKENWIGEQCSETEENLRKNNSKGAYQLVKDLTTVNAYTNSCKNVSVNNIVRTYMMQIPGRRNVKSVSIFIINTMLNQQQNISKISNQTCRHNLLRPPGVTRTASHFSRVVRSVACIVT